MKVTQVIKKVLEENAPPDLAKLYDAGMEVQVNVAADGGERVKRCFVKDGERWFNIRIPKNADTEPVYKDWNLRFSPTHFEAIGLTGWDWKRKVSRWVGFDFDSIRSHTIGLSDGQLQELEFAIKGVDWVTVRRSTSGSGFHLYVHFSNPPETATHTEHAALARSVLGVLSVATGYRLEDDVDKIGQVLWFWHRRKTKQGLTLVRQGEELSQIPQNWRDHLEVIQRKRPRTRFRGVKSTEDVDELVIRTKRVPLGPGHRTLIGWFSNQDPQPVHWWDSDRGCFVCHTHFLKKAHRTLGLDGYFETASDDAEWGENTQNCFMFPLARGWQVFRHSKGVAEHRSWKQTNAGWTTCRYDVPCDPDTAAKIHGGARGRGTKYEYPSMTAAAKGMAELGAVLYAPPDLSNRATTVEQKGSSFFITTLRSSTDSDFIGQGWYPKGKGKWEIRVEVETEAPDTTPPDDRVRYLTRSGEAMDWAINTPSGWLLLPRIDVGTMLKADGLDPEAVTQTMGNCILQHWALTNRPFVPEYPGGRVWNKDAPELSCLPMPGETPTWDLMLNHLGRNIDYAVQDNQWCYDNHITTGAQYLQWWAYLLFRRPEMPLPYLFFYSTQQNTGKSKFHEALKLCIKGGKGYVYADEALKNSSGFNGELQGAVLCAVEEINLGSKGSATAYNRMKPWVTNPDILIHPKGMTPYTTANYTHWVQTANDRSYCPVFPHDTRITMVRVTPYEGDDIPAPLFLKKLADEAPAFLFRAFKATIPPSAGRLGLPALETDDKIIAMDMAVDQVTRFLEGATFQQDGYVIPVMEAYEKFLESLTAEHRSYWNPRRFSGNIPDHYTKGRYGRPTHQHIGNRSWCIESTVLPKLVTRKGHLVTVKEARRMALQQIEEMKNAQQAE